ncbi:MAG TPA: hypothetical protein VHK63_00460 [Candidatus Limnocylindria bacterium]|nr:hypothetical protein [Candidatus Limnocylindria bacterium]
MNGFAGTDAAGTAATWVAAAVTVGVWSYFAGGARIFRLAQYLLAGLATGYLVVVSVREVLVPRLLLPLAADPGGVPLSWLGLALVALLVAGRWLPPLAASVPVSLLVAATAAFALGGAVVGTLLPQLGATVLPASAAGADLASALLGLAITGLVLFTFLHGVRRGRVAAAAAGAGQWLLLGGIGGWLGFLLVSRLALLLDRVRFLLGDWLGIVR